MNTPTIDDELTSETIAKRIEYYESLVNKEIAANVKIEFALALNTLFSAGNRIHFIERVYPGVGRWVRTDFYITQ